MTLQLRGPEELRPAPSEIRRVLFFGKNMSRTRCTGALVDGLREHGLQVRWRNMATLRRWLGYEGSLRWARREFRRYRPDLVFVFFRDLPPALLDEFRRDCRIVLWCEEALEDCDSALLDYFAMVDLVCMSNPAKLPWLREHGIGHAMFLMSGFSPRFHAPAPAQPHRRDVAFIGGPGRKGQRARLLASISEHFDTEVFGHNWDRWQPIYPNLKVRRSVDYRGYRKVCASSRIVLGCNEINDSMYYFSNRTFLTLACGGFHLTHYVPRLEDVFQHGEHLVWFDGADDALEQIAHWLDRPEQRAQIAASGHSLVMNHHRYFHRISRILDWFRGGDRSAKASELRLLPEQAASAAAEASPNPIGRKVAGEGAARRHRGNPS